MLQSDAEEGLGRQRISLQHDVDLGYRRCEGGGIYADCSCQRTVRAFRLEVGDLKPRAGRGAGETVGDDDVEELGEEIVKLERESCFLAQADQRQRRPRSSRVLNA